MFFYASKIFWFFAAPGNLLFLAIGAAALASFFRTPSWSFRILRWTFAVVLLLAVFPVGTFLTNTLENRFPANPPLPDTIDGVIILGGTINPSLSALRKSPQISNSVERILVGAEFARKHPRAKIIFSGGSGDPLDPETREAHYAPPVFAQMGLEPSRIIYEDKARNTAENATFSAEIARPSVGETWVLITSAFHMPRAMGSFRQAGWKIVPYPVDFYTSPEVSLAPSFQLLKGLLSLSLPLHEYIGLTAYWLTGRTDTWFPGPQ